MAEKWGKNRIIQVLLTQIENAKLDGYKFTEQQEEWIAKCEDDYFSYIDQANRAWNGKNCPGWNK